MNRILQGAISGAVATIPMTVPILAARSLHLFRTPPPVQISDEIASRTEVLPERSEPGFTPSWLAGHIGYGAACGAVFAIARPALPESRITAGLLFGETVWGVSYLGYLPVLGIYPFPEDDSRARTATMILAHAVYGVALAGVERTLRHQNQHLPGSLSKWFHRGNRPARMPTSTRGQ
jgi:uncharacterized membrane protein YagU involved in acid resistance